MAYDQLEQCLRYASADPDARCVIITGADPAFCSGDDVVEIMAGPKAVHRQPVVRHAITPAALAALECEKPMIAAVNGVGGFYRLPAIVGPAKAAELLFTGDVIDAAEAQRIQLVSEVVAHATLLARANAMAARIAANPPLALRYMKEGLRRSAYGDPCEIGAWAIETIRALMETADHREGVAAFMEKRDPVFEGR